VSEFNVRTVHEFDAGSGIRRLIRVHPYVRLRGPADSPPVYLQSGHVYDESGVSIDPPPKWVRDAVKGLTPAARAAVGWGSDVAPA
jgi:hypothetical protein